jgi:hypothetical protein
MRVGKRARDVRDLQISQTAQRAAALVNDAPDRAGAAARFLIVFADGLQSCPPPMMPGARSLARSAPPAGAPPRPSRSR